MISRFPIRFGTLSSLRGTGLSVSADPASVAIILTEAPHRVPAPRFPIRFGTLSSLRGTGLSVSADPASVAIILTEAPHRVPAPRFPIRFGRMGATQGRGLAFRTSRVSAAFDRAEYDVTREIAFRATAAFAQLYAEAYPDVSGGVNITFEEI